MEFSKWVITETAYPGNIGIEEMVKFYRVASKSEIKEMEKAVERKNWEDFKNIIKKVLGVELK